jgi:sugar phosphate isomerase/epimerase
MSKLPIGLQLYSIRADTAADPAGSLANVAAMGYEGVEFAGFFDWTAVDLRRALDDLRLQACGAHIGIQTLLPDVFEESVEFHHIIGNKFLIVPGLPAEYTGSAAHYRQAAALFNEIAAKLEPHGMYVGYHCHDGDFRPVEGEIPGDQVPWEVLADNTDDRVVLQMDTGNCLAGGGDPVEYLRRYPGRALTVHLKADYAHQENALIGEDQTDYPAIFAVCEQTAGTQWYIVEQEEYPVSPLESVKIGLENLRRMGL